MDQPEARPSPRTVTEAAPVVATLEATTAEGTLASAVRALDRVAPVANGWTVADTALQDAVAATGILARREESEIHCVAPAMVAPIRERAVDRPPVSPNCPQAAKTVTETEPVEGALKTGPLAIMRSPSADAARVAVWRSRWSAAVKSIEAAFVRVAERLELTEESLIQAVFCPGDPPMRSHGEYRLLPVPDPMMVTETEPVFAAFEAATGLMAPGMGRS